jgi:hypothetical protein
MKAFRFSLEQVRLWRNEQAELEELKLQKIHMELHELHSLAQRVQAESDQAARTVLSGPSAEAHELAMLDSFRDYTRNRLKQIAAQTVECQGRASAQRQKLIDARRQFELLDKLKTKTMADWRLGRDKEQEELAAELFLAKRTRNRD